MKKNSVLWMLSLARKAGKVDVGAFLSEKAIKSGRAVMVLVACDSSENTKKKFKDSCSFYEIECFEYSTKEELAHFTGKENVSVIAVCDENFANGIRKNLEEMMN